MDVVEVSFEILFIPDGVLPKSTLPNAAPAFSAPFGESRLLETAAGAPLSRELSLDSTPPHRIPAVPRGESPKGVQVIGQ